MKERIKMSFESLYLSPYQCSYYTDTSADGDIRVERSIVKVF